MKYKNIKSGIHNFGHSFLSLMNYVDGDYVINDIIRMNKNGYNLKIDWLVPSIKDNPVVTQRIRKSISLNHSFLKRQLLSENVKIEKLNYFHLIWSQEEFPYVIAEDDRGITHKKTIKDLDKSFYVEI
jgi:hypothetical protein